MRSSKCEESESVINFSLALHSKKSIFYGTEPKIKKIKNFWNGPQCGIGVRVTIILVYRNRGVLRLVKKKSSKNCHCLYFMNGL